VGGAGLGLLTHLTMARLLGAADYGAYSLALTWISVLAVLAVLGQNSSVVRFVPRYIHHREWAELRGLRISTRVLVLAASVLVATILAGVVYLLRTQMQSTLTHTLWMACLVLLVLTQLQLSGALHRGLKRAASSGFFNSVFRPLVVLGVVLVAGYGMRVSFSAPLAMSISLFAVLCAWITSEGVLAKAWPTQARVEPPKYEIRTWLGVGVKLLLLAGIGIVLNRVDVMIVGGVMGADSVGPYYAAVQMANLAAYGLNAVNTILAPLIAEKFAANDRVGLNQLVRRAATLTFASTCLISLITAVSGYWVLSMFGAGFVVAYVPLLIVLAGQCLSATMGPVGYLMTMTNYERPAAIIFGAGACINVVLSLALIPKFALVGAATAAAISTAVWNIVALKFVRSRLNVNPAIFPMSSHEAA
jgi:O-antigen/teichoic acid export membrane protein